MSRFTKLSTIGATLCAAALLAGCAGQLKSNRDSYDGKYYNARLKSERGAQLSFVVTVSDAAKGLAGAKEAARHRATKHCIRWYGTSAIDWTTDGPDTPDDQLQLVNGGLTFAGMCVDER